MHPSSLCWLSRLPLLLAFAAVSASVGAQELVYCPASTFADCTQAKDCQTANAGSKQHAKQEIAVCTCQSVTKDSVTIGKCMPPEEDGKLQSRYPGVPAVGVCTSPSKAWAACLGVDCSPASAEGETTCKCTVDQASQWDSQQFITTTTQWADAEDTCTVGIISSATVGQLFQSTVVLRQGRQQASSGSETEDPVLTWVYPPSE